MAKIVRRNLIRPPAETCLQAISTLTAVALAVTGLFIGLIALAPDAGAATQIVGTGSSFAAPAIDTWTHDVASAPYNLNVNFSSTSSGDGRWEFTNRTTDFAASDIAYGLGNTDATPPNFPFIYVPITGAGISFMYNIPGLT